MPSGGPKDRTPPQIKESFPENFSTNFNQKKITIKFDEFIKLRDVNRSLIVSPALAEKPKITVKGKTLVIDINNDLKDSTTYVFNFGGSIIDITEGNSNENFSFVFSTGNYIDSLLIAGKVVNSFDLTPEQGVLVLLYEQYEDSVPLKEQPAYVAKTNDNGEFVVPNLKKNKYKIFALKDANNNYKFDMPNEEIAFLDSLISPYAEYIEKIDTIVTDNKDSLNQDSIVDNSYVKFFPRNMLLHLFAEDHSKQYIVNNKRERKEKLLLLFNKTLKDSIIHIKPLNFSKNKITIEKNTGIDTVICWILDSSIYNKDTLSIVASYLKKDSSEQFVLHNDTLSFVYREKINKKDELPDTNIVFRINVADGSKLGFNKSLIFDFDAPLQSFDISKIRLIEFEDTVGTIVNYKFFKDNLFMRRYHLSYDWNEEREYKIFIFTNAFTDITGKTNTDTLKAGFFIDKQENFGNIKINMKNVRENAIILLMDTKLNIIRQKHIDKDKSIDMTNLRPGDYEIKIILDKNSNRKWDTGNYLKHLQPEKVIFKKEPVNVKANWDLDIDIDLDIDNN